MKTEFKGVFPAMLTPFKDGGDTIDLDAIPSYCDFLIEREVDGLFVGGTTGEGLLMSPEERQSLAECVVKHVQGRVKVIFHSGALTTRAAIALTQFACDAGADAAAVVAPFFYSYDDMALRSHFEAIANATPGFPLYVYSLPQCANNHIRPSLLADLFAIGNFVGVKASNPDFTEIESYLRISAGKDVFVGNDEFDLPALKSGASGIVSGNASAFPEPFVKLYRAVQTGMPDIASRQQEIISELAKLMGYGCYPARHKRVLELRGVRGGDVRKPHRALTPPDESALKDSLARLELEFDVFSSQPK
jgi:dihydrodipicolinate synthase/N-acetylneuraminate lyase